MWKMAAGPKDWRVRGGWLGLVGVVVLAAVMLAGIHRYGVAIDAEAAFILGGLTMMGMHFGSWFLFAVGAPECRAIAFAALLSLAAAHCAGAAAPIPAYWDS